MRVAAMQKKDILFLALLIVIVLGVYGRSLDFGLIWDSKNYLGPDFAQSGEHTFSSALKQGYFKESYAAKSYYYRPLTLATFVMEKSLWGIKSGYLRSVNILIYILSLMLLFVFFKRQSPHPYFPEIATALFALYPLNMENVVWVVGRGDLFVLLWGILILLLTELWISKRKHTYWILGCLVFMIGLLSKESFAFMIPILILYELVKRKKILIPYHAFVISASVVFFLSKSRMIGVKNLDLYFSSSLVENAKAFLASLGYYFKTMIFPLIYDRFFTLYDLINLKHIAFGTMALLAFVFLALRSKKNPSILIPLSLVVVFTSAHLLLIFTPIFQYKVYARYMMLPGLGLVWLLAATLAKRDIRIKAPVSLVLILLFIVSISLNIKAYRSNIHFWQSAHSSLPQNGYACYSLASAYAEDKDYISTELYLNKTLSYALDKPTAVSISLLYADIEFRKARYKNVIRWLDNATQNLGYPETNVAVYRNAQINLMRGQVYLSQGKVKDAIQIFKKNINTLEGYEAQKGSCLALLSLYLGQEMWGEAKSLESRIRKDHPNALDKSTVEIENIFAHSSPEKKIRYYTHYMNYPQAIQGILSLSELNFETQFPLAELYYLADMRDKAEGVIKDIISESEGGFQILNSIGYFYLNRLLRVKEALVFFNKSLAVRKDQPEITRLVARLQNEFLNQLTEVW
jgi:tetratricopeptide (TPR) repeat protein